MSSAVRSRMTHRALVERDNAASPDAYGGKGPPEWETHIAALPCFFYLGQTSQSEELEQPRGIVVHQELRMIFPSGSDVTERDRINGISDRQGGAIKSGYLNIASITPHHNHLEARLEATA